MDRNCCIPETCLMIKARGPINGQVATIVVWGKNRPEIEAKANKKIDDFRNANYLISRMYYQ